jgi:putative Holliday junction resolvase
MVYDNFHEFIKSLGGSGRLLGLDIGTKTIGLAICDARHKIASPLTTIKRTKFSKDLNRLREHIAEQEAIGLVLGLPLNTDGTEGAKCQSVRQFARNTLKEFDVPIAFWDERFSTIIVTDTLIEANISRQKRAEVVDKMAASYILQGAIDTL